MDKMLAAYPETTAVFKVDERGTDGLTDVVNDDYLEYFMMNSASPAEELVEWAMESGSTDNVSVIAARIGGGEFGEFDNLPDDDGRFDAWA